MCEPMTIAITMAAISIASTAAAAGVKAYSDYQQGKASEQQAKAEAEQLKYQAKLDQERANVAQIQGEQEAARRSKVLAADIGSTYANWAGNGLLVDGSGAVKDSLTDVVNTQTAEGVEDISNIRDNTAIEVWKHQSNAAASKASSLNALVAGKNAKRTGALKAVGTGLQGVADTTDKTISYGQKFGYI